MKLKVKRINDNGESTIGLLFIDDVFECFTLEDEQRTVKIFGETRIPKGIYEIDLRKEGGHNQRYLKRYGSSFHKGMLHIKNVPNFKWILIHVGNDDDDTAGCLLLGDVCYNNSVMNGFISESRKAYERVYQKVINQMNKGVKVTIEYEE